MAFINKKNKEIQVKIVYYGPNRSGKTTNLEYIYRKLDLQNSSGLITIKTNGSRTLFFDFLPINIGLKNGYQIKVQLYTVPGQVKYDATRRLVLRGVDGIVFVADLIASRRNKNIETLKNLIENLALYGKNIETIPCVFQYNKIDLDEQNISLIPLNVLNHDLNNQLNKSAFPACAIRGVNVIATLKKIIIKTVDSVKEDIK